MPDQQPTDGLHPLDVLERELLYTLTSPDDNQPLWSLDDLARELECSEVSVTVRALHRAGLINRTTDGYIFATRSAIRMIQLVGHGII